MSLITKDHLSLVLQTIKKLLSFKADWNQTDETAVDYIKNKPEIATDENIMDMLSEIGAVTPVTTADGSIITSPTGEIYTL